jgi:hypothetical protein
MTLTIDQLRAYLERREEEARAHVSNIRRDAYEADRATKTGRHTWDVFVVASARLGLYRELLEGIENGVLPE